MANNSVCDVGEDEGNNNSSKEKKESKLSNKNYTGLSSVGRILRGKLLLAAVAFGCFFVLLIYNSFNHTFPFLPVSYSYIAATSFSSSSSSTSQIADYGDELEKILRNATMEDDNKTVIITTLNDAWAEPNSIFELFVESFRIGIDTERLLKHLVVVCLDDKAFGRCLTSLPHGHCFQLRTKSGNNFTSEAFFMSSGYLDMMWTRIHFLSSVLQMGYSFVFTDTDIMWLRDPFPRFFKEADFQIACDSFNGNSYDRHNKPNGGFTYVRSNDRTINFYKFWYFSRRAFPKLHDQDVLNRIKFDPFVKRIGLKMRFLDTAYFGGFCQPSSNLHKVCTMHANCCVGLNNKINDLAILLQDWTRFLSNQPNTTNLHPSWSVPQNCRIRRRRCWFWSILCSWLQRDLFSNGGPVELFLVTMERILDWAQLYLVILLGLG